MVDVLERLVTAETPSNDPDLIGAGMRLAAQVIEEIIGIVPELLDVRGRPLLRVRGEDGGILVLCHFDTVWPAGTIARWPFTVTDGRATGPGAFDMKAGLVQALFAMRGLADIKGITLLVTSDEEIGSPASQAFIEDEARRARCVLVLEPGLGAPRQGRPQGHLDVQAEHHGARGPCRSRTGARHQRACRTRGAGPRHRGHQQYRCRDDGDSDALTCRHCDQHRPGSCGGRHRRPGVEHR